LLGFSFLLLIHNGRGDDALPLRFEICAEMTAASRRRAVKRGIRAIFVTVLADRGR
jgi:hypothetical protein